MNDLSISVRELSGQDVARGHAAMHELRGHRPPLASAETFVAWVSGHPEGYRIAGAFLDGETDAAAVIGFRPMTLLYAGRTLYVDDLSTRAADRGRGGERTPGLGRGRSAAAGLRGIAPRFRRAAPPSA